MLFKRSALALCIATLLGGCSALTLRGGSDLTLLDPLNTPPEELGFAVSVPDTLILRDGDAIVRLTLTVAEDMLVEARVPLSLAPVSDTSVARLPEGDVMYSAYLTPQNAAALTAAQAEIRVLRAAGTTGQGTFSIAVVGGCRFGPALDAFPVATWLRLRPSARYVSLTGRMDMFDTLVEAGATVGPCPE